jgi:hypothetical protein
VPGSNLTSLRIPEETKHRLDVAARAVGQSRSALMQRYIEEGLRMDRHPGIVFRPGPAGRRAGLAGGPDVWEIIQVVKNAETRGEGAIAMVASWLGISPDQVRIAVDYYAEFCGEIESWLENQELEAAEAEATWRRRQAVLR